MHDNTSQLSESAMTECRWAWLSQAARCGWWTRLFQAAVRWFHNNVAFHNSIPFITALVFSHGLVEKGVIQFLVVYVTNLWKEDVRLVVILWNVQQGLSQTMSLVLDATSEKWTGPFLMVVISTVSYAAGMWLLYFSTKFLDYNIRNVVLLFILAILPTAIGIGGQSFTLCGFISDQMNQLEKQNPQTQQQKELDHDIDNEKDPNKCIDIKKEKEKEVEQDENMMDEEERAENRMKFWVRIGKLLGALPAFLWFGDMNWSNLFKFSAIVIMVSGFLFACGFRRYHRRKPSGSAFGGAFRVIIAALRKRCLQYPHSPAQFYQNQENECVLWPRDSLFRCLRWVDKAAIVMPTHTLQEQERKKLLFPVAKVEAAKFLLAMTPLLGTLFISSLGEAAGNNFFYLQADQMNRRVEGFKIPFAYVTVTKSFSSGTAILAFGPIIKKLWKRRSKTRPWKPKLGLGFFCLFLSCIAAWLVETRRIDLFQRDGLVDVEGQWVVDMSILWLTPQFWLLGFSQGFSDDGLKDFYYIQAVENRNNFLYWAFPSGTFASIAWILAFQSWFDKTINESRLKDYYVGVAILCFVNLFFYLWACNLSIFDTTTGRRHEGCDSIPGAEEQVELEKPAGLPSNPVLPSIETSIEGVTEVASSLKYKC
ncbi:hypothetical protein NMG60_11000222 [Bertholletia excelsa]